MARYQFDQTLLRQVEISGLTAVDVETATGVYIYTDAARTIPASVYPTSAGGSPLSLPLLPDSAGRVTGWVDAGATYYWREGTVEGSFVAVTGDFEAGIDLTDDTGNTTKGISFGSLADTKLYRTGAAALRLVGTLVGRVLDRGGLVFNVDAYGADPTGAAFSDTAFTDALAAAVATGRGGEIRFGPGLYKLAGPYAYDDAITVAGVGPYSTTINHTGNNILFTSLGNSPGAHDEKRRAWKNMRIEGNSGNTAGAIVHGEVYGLEVENVHITGYTAGVGLKLTNVVSFTHGASYTNVSIWDCLVCFDITTALSGTNREFEGLKMRNVHLAPRLTGTGLKVEGTSRIQGSDLDVRFSLVVGGVGLDVRDTAIIEKSRLLGHAETDQTNPGLGTSYRVGATASMTVSGQFTTDLVTNTVESVITGGVARFSNTTGEEVMYNGTSTRVKKLASKANVTDGNLLLVAAPNNISGAITLTYTASGQYAHLRMEVDGRTGVLTPFISITSDDKLALRIFGEPYFDYQTSGNAYPHLYIPLTNTGTPNTLSMMVDLAEIESGQLTTFPASPIGTLTGVPRTGTQFWVRDDGVKLGNTPAQGSRITGHWSTIQTLAVPTIPANSLSTSADISIPGTVVTDQVTVSMQGGITSVLWYVQGFVNTPGNVRLQYIATSANAIAPGTKTFLIHVWR